MRLREILYERRISIKGFARISGIPIRTIEDILRRDTCNLKTAIRIANALNISLDALCGRDMSQQ